MAPHIMLIEARYYAHISDELAKGAIAALDAAGASYERFAVPGAFTPGCSKIHLPGYVQNAAELRAKGVDVIACVSVNDAWVMEAWGRDQGVGDAILMLADGAGEFTKAMGLEADLSGAGLGVRSRRYAAILDNGVVTDLQVEPKPGVDLSACESMLARL